MYACSRENAGRTLEAIPAVFHPLHLGPFEDRDLRIHNAATMAMLKPAVEGGGGIQRQWRPHFASLPTLNSFHRVCGRREGAFWRQAESDLDMRTQLSTLHSVGSITELEPFVEHLDILPTWTLCIPQSLLGDVSISTTRRLEYMQTLLGRRKHVFRHFRNDSFI
jgi:hypothetical protein